MNDETSNPNIEWKKPGFDFNEKATLKTNIRKAVEYEAKNKNAGLKKFTPAPAELPNGLRKIRKKVKDVFDEDDEDENDFQTVGSPLEQANTLFNALQENEKKIFKQQEDINTINSLQQVQRSQAVINAEKLAKESGLKKLDKNVVGENLQNITLGRDITSAVVTDQVARSFKFKGEKIPATQAKKLIKGIKRIQEVGGKEAIAGMKFNDVLEAGAKKRDDKEMVKMLLKKSGRVDADGKLVKQSAGTTQAKNAELMKRLEKARN